ADRTRGAGGQSAAGVEGQRAHVGLEHLGHVDGVVRASVDGDVSAGAAVGHVDLALETLQGHGGQRAGTADLLAEAARVITRVVVDHQRGPAATLVVVHVDDVSGVGS